MSTQPKFQGDPFEKLKKILESTPRSHDVLARCVRQLELHQKEEEIFIQLAFENANDRGAGTGPFIMSPFSQLYEPFDAERKLEMRRWWHQMVRGKANEFDDLKTRLSKIT